jgi:hypothetical protein
MGQKMYKMILEDVVIERKLSNDTSILLEGFWKQLEEDVTAKMR